MRRATPASPTDTGLSTPPPPRSRRRVIRRRAPDAVKLIDQRGRGIGAIDHLLVYVDAFLHDEETDDFIPCDAEGRTDDPYGPDSIYCHDALDTHPRLKAAWDKAVRAKWDYLDYKADDYYTVRAFLDEDRGDAVDGGKDDAK